MVLRPFDALNFDFGDEKKIVKFIEDTIDNAKVLMGRGEDIDFEYRVWEDGNLQVWFFIADNELQNIKAFYQGEKQYKLGIYNYFIEEEDSSGGFVAWIEPNEDLTDGQSTFVFEVPDFWNNAPKELPSLDTVAITAFVMRAQIFENKQELEADGDDSGIQLTDNMFVPTGLFNEEGHPLPIALFSGEITKVEEHTNSYSGRKFYHLTVKSIIDFDVIAPEGYFDKKPAPGNFIKGDFYMSGRLI